MQSGIRHIVYIHWKISLEKEIYAWLLLEARICGYIMSDLVSCRKIEEQSLPDRQWPINFAGQRNRLDFRFFSAQNGTLTYPHESNS